MTPSSPSTPPTPGLRVQHRVTGRLALVVARAEAHRGTYLVPVTLEGTTRTELWPLTLLDPLPQAQQLKAHGGAFVPPKGYPLNTDTNP